MAVVSAGSRATPCLTGLASRVAWRVSNLLLLTGGPSMKKYKVIISDLRDAEVEAERVQVESYGLTFYRGADIVAQFRDWMGYYEIN